MINRFFSEIHQPCFFWNINEWLVEDDWLPIAGNQVPVVVRHPRGKCPPATNRLMTHRRATELHCSTGAFHRIGSNVAERRAALKAGWQGSHWFRLWVVVPWHQVFQRVGATRFCNKVLTGFWLHIRSNTLIHQGSSCTRCWIVSGFERFNTQYCITRTPNN